MFFRTLKFFGRVKARKARTLLIKIIEDKNKNISAYGKAYLKTLEFEMLQLNEKIAKLKYEFYKSFFRL